MARKLAAPFPEWLEEFRSAAFLGLVEAAQQYDPERGVNFATFARHHIGWALRGCRRDLLNRGPSDHKQARGVIPISEAVGDRGHLVGVKSDEPVGAPLERREAVEAWISRLPRQHAETFKLIYLDGRTQEETAVAVGRSKSSISRMHDQGLTWLRHGLAGNGSRQGRERDRELPLDACA